MMTRCRVNRVVCAACVAIVVGMCSTARAENCVDFVKRMRADLRFQWSARGYAKDLWDNWPSTSMWKGSVPRPAAVMVLDTVPNTGIENGHVAYVVQAGYNSATRKYEWVRVRHSGWGNDPDGSEMVFNIDYEGGQPRYVRKQTAGALPIVLRGFVYDRAGYSRGQ